MTDEGWDSAECGVDDCTDQVSFLLAKKCCDETGLRCAKHYVMLTLWSGNMQENGRSFQCSKCNHVYPPGSGLSDMVFEVRL